MKGLSDDYTAYKATTIRNVVLKDIEQRVKDIMENIVNSRCQLTDVFTVHNVTGIPSK